MSRQDNLLTALLYPQPGSLLDEEHYEQLATLLDSAAARSQLRTLVLERIERQRRAGIIWEQCSTRLVLSSPDEEPLVRLSATLAERLEARVERRVALPLVVLLAFLLGLICGALAVWLLNSDAVQSMLH